MDNLGVRLPVDATAKSKFESDRPSESYESRNALFAEKCMVKLSGIDCR